MTIDLDDLEQLIAIAERANINALEVIDGDLRIHIVCHPDAYPSLNPDLPTSRMASAGKSSNNSASQQHGSDKVEDPVSKTTASEDAASTVAGSTDTAAEQDTSAAATTPVVAPILAPMLGTFYLRPNPDADKFVQVGDPVAAGATLCVVEAMKIMHEVKAPSDCMIQEVLVAEGEVVEYEQPLFTVSPL